MIKKTIIFLGLLILVLSLYSQIEARRRGGIIIGVSGAQPETWAYRKLVTISSSMIPATAGTLTNFPVLISWGTDTAIASHAQANGNDIKFMSYDATTQLFHEREYYEGTSGKGVFWVRIPALTPATYTMWMYYGNPTVGYQGSNTAVWDSNYSGVWHLNEPTGTIIKDSSINANDGLLFGGVALNATGRINGAANLDGINDYGIIASSDSLNLTQITKSWWFRPITKSGGGIYDRIFGWTNYRLDIGYIASTLEGLYAPLYIYTPLTSWLNTGNNLLMGSWNFLVLTYDNTTFRLYVNGLLQWSYSAANAVNTGQQNFYIATHYGIGDYAKGIIDEVRISNIVRNANWIGTSYNNQSNPSAYITIGNEETL